MATEPSNMEFEVIQGDIAQLSAGAVVNASNTSLQMGSGVAAAIREAAGRGITRELEGEGPVDPGDVVVTDAYELDATWVFHAAALPDDGDASQQSVRTATRNALGAAEERGIQSLVMPALGTGEGGLDLEEGVRAMFEEIDEFEPAALESVEVIAYGDEDYEQMQEIAREYGG